jgi:hypothetical protein
VYNEKLVALEEPMNRRTLLRNSFFTLLAAWPLSKVLRFIKLCPVCHTKVGEPERSGLCATCWQNAVDEVLRQNKNFKDAFYTKYQMRVQDFEKIVGRPPNGLWVTRHDHDALGAPGGYVNGCYVLPAGFEKRFFEEKDRHCNPIPIYRNDTQGICPTTVTWLRRHAWASTDPADNFVNRAISESSLGLHSDGLEFKAHLKKSALQARLQLGLPLTPEQKRDAQHETAREKQRKQDKVPFHYCKVCGAPRDSMFQLDT